MKRKRGGEVPLLVIGRGSGDLEGDVSVFLLLLRAGAILAGIARGVLCRRAFTGLESAQAE